MGNLDVERYRTGGRCAVTDNLRVQEERRARTQIATAITEKRTAKEIQSLGFTKPTGFRLWDMWQVKENRSVLQVTG